MRAGALGFDLRAKRALLERCIADRLPIFIDRRRMEQGDGNHLLTRHGLDEAVLMPPPTDTLSARDRCLSVSCKLTGHAEPIHIRLAQTLRWNDAGNPYGEWTAITTRGYWFLGNQIDEEFTWAFDETAASAHVHDRLPIRDLTRIVMSYLYPLF